MQWRFGIKLPPLLTHTIQLPYVQPKRVQRATKMHLQILLPGDVSKKARRTSAPFLQEGGKKPPSSQGLEFGDIGSRVSLQCKRTLSCSLNACSDTESHLLSRQSGCDPAVIRGVTMVKLCCADKHKPNKSETSISWWGWSVLSASRRPHRRVCSQAHSNQSSIDSHTRLLAC